MNTLFTNIGALVTAKTGGKSAKAGAEMQYVGEIKDGAFLVSDEFVRWVGTSEEAQIKMDNLEILVDDVVDCSGKAVLPGFVDSHTHLVFAGSRADEFARRLRGVPYQQIATEGGGIIRTMNSVRSRSAEELAIQTAPLLLSAMKYGTTAIEMKSGYGLNFNSELAILRAIQMLKEQFPLQIYSTFLGAHDIPPEYKNNRKEYIRIICEEMIPAIAAENLADFCDVFTDYGYFTIEESEQICEVAQLAGMKIKIHADELADTNASAMAARLGATSADHLLRINDQGISAMKKAGVVGTLLPGTAYFLGLEYAPARQMLDAGMIIAIATDCNPGSCFCENMQMILSLACNQMKMTVEEAICAATINGAAALGDTTMGSIEVGKFANFILTNVSEYANLVYHFGVNHVHEVWIKGKREIVNY